MWRDLMFALGLWQTPPKQVVQVAPPAIADCRIGGRPIRRVFKQHRARLERCYSRIVQFRGGDEGTAVVHATIAPDGNVLRVRVDGTLEDARITKCVAAEVKSWTFPPEDETTVITYPIRFHLNR